MSWRRARIRVRPIVLIISFWREEDKYCVTCFCSGTSQANFKRLQEIPSSSILPRIEYFAEAKNECLNFFLNTQPLRVLVSVATCAPVFLEQEIMLSKLLRSESAIFHGLKFFAAPFFQLLKPYGESCTAIVLWGECNIIIPFRGAHTIFVWGGHDLIWQQ